MAIKANASSQGGSFKKYCGMASFKVIGVNPTKEELEKFYGREMQNEPQYLTDKVDDKDGNKPYKSLRVTYMILAEDPSAIDPKNKATLDTNANLTEPLPLTVSFFLDSRYQYNSDKTKVKVMDKYARTAWVTIEQAKNHQIPVYKNGPARIDKDYHPMLHGEEELTQFILNWLNVTPIDTWNKNSGQWMTNSHPEDCEGNLYEIKEYFKGNISELKNHCKMMPDNHVKLCVGVQTDSEGKQHQTVYTRVTFRNGSKSYTPLKDDIDGRKEWLKDVVFTNDPVGIITNIEEYKENVKETDFSKKPAADNDPFVAGAALPDDDNNLPFDAPTEESDSDPFA